MKSPKPIILLFTAKIATILFAAYVVTLSTGCPQACGTKSEEGMCLITSLAPATLDDENKDLCNENAMRIDVAFSKTAKNTADFGDATNYVIVDQNDCANSIGLVEGAIVPCEQVRSTGSCGGIWVELKAHDDSGCVCDQNRW